MSYPRLTKCMPDETRHNPFHLLHKALRFGHCRMLSELGAQDFGDDAARSPPAAAAGRPSRSPSRRRRGPAGRPCSTALAAHGLEVAAAACQDHAGHLTALAELRSLVRAVNVAAPQRRRLAGRSIYRCYALYASSDMARMDEDETLLLTALHDSLPDEELRGIEGRRLALLAPAHFEALLRLLLPPCPPRSSRPCWACCATISTAPFTKLGGAARCGRCSPRAVRLPPEIFVSEEVECDINHYISSGAPLCPPSIERHPVNWRNEHDDELRARTRPATTSTATSTRRCGWATAACCRRWVRWTIATAPAPKR